MHCISIDQKYHYKVLMITIANGSGTLLKFAIFSFLMIHPQSIWQPNCNSYFETCFKPKTNKIKSTSTRYINLSKTLVWGLRQWKRPMSGAFGNCLQKHSPRNISRQAWPTNVVKSTRH